MTRTGNVFVVFVLALMLLAGVAYSQTVVTANQGAPGKQGAWPVKQAATTSTWAVDFSNCDGDGGVLQFTTNIATDGGNLDIPSGTYKYVVVTNSSQNTSGNLKCRIDNTSPVFALGNPGDYLTAGQSIKYVTAHTIRCISDVGGQRTDGGGVEVLQTGCR